MSKSVAFSQNWGILKTRMDQRGATWKWILTIFEYKSQCYKQFERKKVDEKNGVICLVSFFPSWVMVCKLSKKANFWQFCADLSKKSKSIKAIYIYASERSLSTLSENGMVYKKMLTQQKFNKFFRLQTLISPKQ